MKDIMLPDLTGYKYSPATRTIHNPLDVAVAVCAPCEAGVLFGYALANYFAHARLAKAAPRLATNLETMTDLAESYGVGAHCDGNILEARELLAEVKTA